MAAASICTAPYICTEPKHAANHGARSVPTVRNDEGGGFMPVFFAVIDTPLYDFAAGCVLAANVFLMIRGGKNYLKGRKK